jgi:exonuclease SbcD
MMRLIHTSDWHLGRSFHREDLLGAQGVFIDHLVETVRAERADCVLVSGDVYDRALPPVDAVELFDQALERLAALTRVVLIAGNHDSTRRLGFGSALLDRAGVHLRTDPRTVGTPIMIDGTACYGIPYLEPELVRAPWELDERSHTAALTEAMGRIRADLAGRPNTPAVVLAHAFVLGGPGHEPQTSDSERDISVGGACHVPVSVFAGVDYVALGHLHGRQKITDRVRYSGSPLAYSFSEEHQVKGCWLVDLDSAGLAAEFVAAPVPRRIARLRGRLDDLLADAAYDRYRDHWLQVTLTDADRPAGAMDRLRRRFPHTLQLGFDAEAAAGADGRSWTSPAAARSELDLARDFVASVTAAPVTEADRALLDEAFQACRVREAAR